MRRRRANHQAEQFSRQDAQPGKGEVGQPTLPPVTPQAAPPTSFCEAGGEQVDPVGDFPPPESRVPSHDEVEGMVMPWPWPLVLSEAIVACAGCGAYRDWLIISTRAQIWLRCRAGHQQPEPRLDTAWFNRHSGPSDATHATFEDCLRHLGR
jgi:hypothetical protein